jgi:hypothetical protein
MADPEKSRMTPISSNFPGQIASKKSNFQDTFQGQNFGGSEHSGGKMRV